MDKEQKNSQLYIVPTPIGNLEDITLRAIKVLKMVDIIIAEDTRTSGVLLKHLEIQKPLQSYHVFNEHQTVHSIIKKIKEGKTFALISDAGTPSISDPGFLLIRECLKEGIAIDCLPGATAFVPALVKSGLPSERFVFEGFLPHKKGRKTRLEALAKEERTIILYESPHRIVKCLEQLAEHLGKERKASVSRELTKLHEETVNGTLEELVQIFSAKTPKGEFVVVVEGRAE
ncbi:16S rRNA (cytidine(1402)-2'-O)-methyltransferase [Thermoflexibacter ruber]|uniref:Ribosomal RNA small subunit methyltransferase I n=1 Tax=Thermoflexibacter ruber TaxID=1003 RepID=A0A1I2EA81_9BACT|nr:16S rRNA (cytidine(1402)-2'-O)-methyltransferase [Thermoflexibacter ruber]SFE89842.1 16S rRNA (cytidine1402-2'-O)-methyltransferase [Thermoflexibacter ruber]